MWMIDIGDEQLMAMAGRVGLGVARQYPGIDPEDIAAEALTRFYEKVPKMAQGTTAQYVYRVLERDAAAYAAKVRYDYVISTRQYIYTPKEVRALLKELYFDPVAWDVPTGKDDWLSAEISGRSVGISLMDLKVGMERIKLEHRSTLERRYLHQDESIHPQTLSRAVDSLARAVNRISAKTGKAADGPGSRDAMTNSRALWVTAAEGGHETNVHEQDAVHRLQKARRQTRTDPPGTHFNWAKYAV